MYESFFGMHRRPFSATPDPRCFAPIPSSQAALDELVVCVERGQGVGILTAPAGTGKTLLCHRLLSELQGAFQTVFLSSGNFPTRGSLLQAVLYELHQPYRQMSEQELRLALLTAVRRGPIEGRGLVLVLDEAHDLHPSALEELRSLTNLCEDGEPLVRVVLSGQLGLEEVLANAELQAFNHRVSCHVVLPLFTQQESAEYIGWRLQYAGVSSERVFTPQSIEVACYASDGLPRAINQLCDHSLLLAYVAEQRPVEAETVYDALDDLKQLPLHWKEPVRMEATLAEARTTHETSAAGNAATCVLNEAHSTQPVAVFETAESIDRRETILPTEEAHFSTEEVGAYELCADEVEAAQTDSVEDCAACETVGDDTACQRERPQMGQAPNVLFRASPILAADAVPSAQPEPLADHADVGVSLMSNPDDWSHSQPELTPACTKCGHEASEEPIEEPVVDRYAALDARIRGADVSGIVWEIGSPSKASRRTLTDVNTAAQSGSRSAPPERAPEQDQARDENRQVRDEQDRCAATAAQTARPAAPQHDFAAQPPQPSVPCDDGHETLADPRPDLIVEEMLPLLNESSPGWVDREPADEPAARWDFQAELVAEPAHEAGDVEEQIGTDVLDICLQTRQALDARYEHSRGPDERAAFEDFRANRPFQIPDESSMVALESRQPPPGERAAFDVVEPPEPTEPDGFGAWSTRPGAERTGHTAPRRNPVSAAPSHTLGSARRPYANLFSELRRRQQSNPRTDRGSPGS